jgi:hypothetical protein
MAPGVLHHLQQRDAVFVHHQPVDFAHLIGRERGDLVILVRHMIGFGYGETRDIIT